MFLKIRSCKDRSRTYYIYIFFFFTQVKQHYSGGTRQKEVRQMSHHSGKSCCKYWGNTPLTPRTASTLYWMLAQHIYHVSEIVSVIVLLLLSPFPILSTIVLSCSNCSLSFSILLFPSLAAYTAQMTKSWQRALTLLEPLKPDLPPKTLQIQ